MEVHNPVSLLITQINETKTKVTNVIQPPRARGSGRSGPRRRTGCLTCRSRKVRCDETKPQCANCTRLQLSCVYNRFFFGSAIPRRQSQRGLVGLGSPTPPPQPPVSVSPPQTQPTAPAIESLPQDRRTAGINFLDTVLRADEQQQQQQQSEQEVTNEPSQDGPDLAGPFDMLGFIGEITSELGQKQMDLTNGISDFISPTTPPSIATTSGGGGPGQHTPRTSPSVGHGATTNHIAMEEFAATPETPTSSGISAQATYEEQLLGHFARTKAPPTIFGPVDVEWTYVRPVFLAQSLESSPLLNAIYCYADVHKAMLEGTRWKLAPTYYRLASSEIQERILGDVNEWTLKRVFTAVFLLMLSEVCSVHLVLVGLFASDNDRYSLPPTYVDLGPRFYTLHIYCSSDSTIKSRHGQDWVIWWYHGSLYWMSKH